MVGEVNVEITLPEGTPWYGWVTVLAVAALVALTPVIISTVRKTSRTEQTVNSVHDQVANTHDTNLREDIDALRDAIREGLAPIAGIRADVQEVKAQSAITATAVDFLSSDARQTRRDIADMRADRRIDSEKIDRIGEQFADHLNREN